MSDTLNFPFIPDMITYTAYQFGVCELCERELKFDEKFDNKECPDCQKKTKMVMGSYSPTKDKMKIQNAKTI